MIRGTTPTLRFTLPESFLNIQISALYVSMAQSGRIVIEKNIDNLILDGQIITISLTQEETLKFKSDIDVEIQISLKDSSNMVYRSNIVKTNVKRILKEGAI